MAGMSSFTCIAPDTLTVCTYAYFAPFSHVVDGRVVGSDISTLERFAWSHGYEVRFDVTDFPNIWERPGRGECDIAAAGIAALSQRDPGSGARWSVPYAVVRRSLLVRRSEVDSLRSPRDFAGRTIVVTESSTADIDARVRYAPIGANIVAALPAQEEMVRRLLDGEIDAYAGGDRSNLYLAASEPRVALVDVHPFEPPETLHFAVRHTDPRLLEALNEFVINDRDSTAESS